MSELQCRSCGAPLDWTARDCPSCNSDNGYPNVRQCDASNEREELNKRYRAAYARAEERDQATKFRKVEASISKDSGVVVSMPPEILRNMCAKPKAVFVNYETLVGSGIQAAAPQDTDCARRATVGKLFGSYAKDIRYGALSCSCFGVARYGVAHCRLKDVSISARTTFLHEDSIQFCDRPGNRDQVAIPAGYRSTWNDRHLLSMAKLEDRLEDFDEFSDDVNGLLISSDSDGNLDYIEAHIHGPFTVHSIESISLSESPTAKHQEKLDYRVAEKDFNALRAPMR